MEKEKLTFNVKNCTDLRNSVIDKFVSKEDFNEYMARGIEDISSLDTNLSITEFLKSVETGKNYIVYTDNTTDEHGNTKVYASIFNPNEPDSKLTAIETEKEWKIIQTILEELQSAGKGE